MTHNLAQEMNKTKLNKSVPMETCKAKLNKSTMTRMMCQQLEMYLELNHYLAWEMYQTKCPTLVMCPEMFPTLEMCLCELTYNLAQEMH